MRAPVGIRRRAERRTVQKRSGQEKFRLLHAGLLCKALEPVNSLFAWRSESPERPVEHSGRVCLLAGLPPLTGRDVFQNLNTFIEIVRPVCAAERSGARPGGAASARSCASGSQTVSYTHLRAHETPEHLVC